MSGRPALLLAGLLWTATAAGGGPVLYLRSAAVLPAGELSLGAIAEVRGAEPQEAALLALVQHALIMGCVPVSGDMWQSYIGAGGWTHGHGERDALKKLLDSQDPATQAVVAAARSVGKRTAHLALLLKAGAEAHRDFLSRDVAYRALLDGVSMNGE